jgi:peptidoglycan/xylan/chitin deacetylase (PgdA/CDA1 family)
MSARMDDAIDSAGGRNVALHDRVLGTRVVAEPFSTVTRRRLRVLGYHDVLPLDRFTAQMAWLSTRFRPVTLEDVAEAVTNGTSLPDRAVWVTFDDGDPAIVECGQRVLDRYGIAATLFVCPAVIDTNEPFWWDIARKASALGADGTSDTSAGSNARTAVELKRVPDAARREAVEQARARLTTGGGSLTRRQLRSDELKGWLAAGHSVGNHTWDHPCLDMCSAAEQERQIVQADTWLAQLGIDKPKAFAYPNGNWAGHAEEVLRNLGYKVGVVFDHRLARVDGPNLAISRLRLSADASLARFRAIVSGSHTAAFSLLRRRR